MFLYNFFGFLLLPFYILWLLYRLAKNKETKQSILHRFSIYKNKIAVDLWLHAASLGESVAAFTLIDALIRIKPEIKIVISTGTITGGNYVKKNLSKNCYHIYLPVDNILFIQKFFRAWRPKLGIFFESELWPALLNETKNHCPVLLINARFSDQSFNNWQKYNFLFKKIIKCYSRIFTQSDHDLEKYLSLGVLNAKSIGNIKFSNKKLEIDDVKYRLLKEQLKHKKTILFASSHIEDENVFLPIIKDIRNYYTNSFIVIIPRHPHRSKEILKACQKLSIKASISSNNDNLDLELEAYIIDDFGQNGLFYKLSYISFIGGSFAQGGHSILEPAHFSNVIIFGPDMNKNYDLAKEALKAAACMQINNGAELLASIKYLLSNEGQEKVELLKNSAKLFIDSKKEILNDYLKEIMPYIQSF